MNNVGRLNDLRFSSSLVSRAYREIEEQIVMLTLAPGTAVSEKYLSDQLDIGRTPVREALHRLAREGLVRISPRRGIFVTEISIDAQLRLLEVRRQLERLIAQRAATFAVPRVREDFLELSRSIREAAEAKDEATFLRLDQNFNKLISDTADNEFATASIGLMAGLSRRFWHRYFQTLPEWPRAAVLHAEVAGAISKGDPDAAGEAMDRLMDFLDNFTRTVFNQAR